MILRDVSTPRSAFIFTDSSTARGRAAVGRPDNESKDEKKARKQVVKAEKQVGVLYSHLLRCAPNSQR